MGTWISLVRSSFFFHLMQSIWLLHLSLHTHTEFYQTLYWNFSHSHVQQQLQNLQTINKNHLLSAMGLSYEQREKESWGSNFANSTRGCRVASDTIPKLGLPLFLRELNFHLSGSKQTYILLSLLCVSLHQAFPWNVEICTRAIFRKMGDIKDNLRGEMSPEYSWSLGRHDFWAQLGAYSSQATWI